MFIESILISSFVLISCCGSKLVRAHLCPHNNGIRCLLLFDETYLVYCKVDMLVSLELQVSITSPNFVAVYLLVSEIAKCTP